MGRRETGTKRTTRPANVRTESWIGMYKKQRKKAIDAWAIEGPAREAAREKRGLYFVPVDDTDYKKVLGEARAKFAKPAAPAMPLKASGTAMLCQGGKRESTKTICAIRSLQQ